tara:strand:+ start:277 stop:513 length:237 start_codon:yes stop_codon:yes gene_type:complete
MKNIKISFLLMVCICSLSITAQDLHLKAGGTITVSAGEQLRVVNGLTALGTFLILQPKKAQATSGGDNLGSGASELNF